MDYERLGESYKATLEQALVEFDSFSLLWARRLGHSKENSSMHEWQEQLGPYFIEEAKVKQHRGLKLKGGTARQRFYRVCPGSIAILAKADNAFEFSGLGIPEKLTFYKAGKVAFRADAHTETIEHFNV